MSSLSFSAVLVLCGYREGGRGGVEGENSCAAVLSTVILSLDATTL